MEGEELDEVELEGFQMDRQTNYCGNMIKGHYLQVRQTPNHPLLPSSVPSRLTSFRSQQLQSI